MHEITNCIMISKHDIKDCCIYIYIYSELTLIEYSVSSVTIVLLHHVMNKDVPSMSGIYLSFGMSQCTIESFK